MHVLEGSGVESYPVKMYFLNEICTFYLCCHGNKKMIGVFSLEIYFIGFLDPKNVYFDTNIIILALTEAKIWCLV